MYIYCIVEVVKRDCLFEFIVHHCYDGIIMAIVCVLIIILEVCRAEWHNCNVILTLLCHSVLRDLILCYILIRIDLLTYLLHDFFGQMYFTIEKLVCTVVFAYKECVLRGFDVN